MARAAAAIRAAGALCVVAGAGMGVDAGLPTFRGPGAAGWPARFSDPAVFDDDPRAAWTFFRERAAAYRAAVPHAGFSVLGRWAEQRRVAVFTTNVDGLFPRAGFEIVQEVHGSVHHHQCAVPCHDGVWPASSEAALPRCPRCGGLARPNVLLFGDTRFVTSRRDTAAARYATALGQAAGVPAVVLEIGAGTAVPTVRHHGRRLCNSLGAARVRINPDPQAADDAAGDVTISAGAAEALAAIDGAL